MCVYQVSHTDVSVCALFIHVCLKHLVQLTIYQILLCHFILKRKTVGTITGTNPAGGFLNVTFLLQFKTNITLIYLGNVPFEHDKS